VAPTRQNPIDLFGKVLGDKKAFNMKTMLISIPQLVLPVLLPKWF
jgi:hypothetical protein